MRNIPSSSPDVFSPRNGAVNSCELIKTTCANGISSYAIERSTLQPGPHTAAAIRALALHFGPVNCGNIGLVAQRDATIIGDAVNAAFRLESVMKELGQDLIFSQDFAAMLNPPRPLIDLGEHQLKGKNQQVRVHALADLLSTEAGS